MELRIEGLKPMEVIGQGGFGVVHRAIDEVHGREVAVKTLTGVFDDSAKRRFDRERRAMGKLSGHPNIGVVHTSGFTAEGAPYIVMEYLPGGSLQDRLDQGTFAVEEVVDIGVALTGALDRAHELGVLHLDLKPANVLYSDFGRPKLVDFGISSIVGDDPATTAIRATPAYGAPEVLDGKPATASSDIYGLAATLYALLMGGGPYSSGGESGLQVIRAVALDPVPRVDRGDVPDELADVLYEAMGKQPQGRPDSMQAFGERLASLATGDASSRQPLATSTGPETIGVPNPTPQPAGHTAPAAAPADISSERAQSSTDRRGQKTGLALLGLAALALVVSLAVVLQRGEDAPPEPQDDNGGLVADPPAAPTPTSIAVATVPVPTPDDRRAVPDVRNIDVDTAIPLLQDAGFQPRVGDHCFVSVEDSEPPAEALLAPGSEVYLYFAPCVVPNFVGLRLPEAVALTEELVAIGIEWPDFCDDLISGQSVAPGSIVAPGSTTVTLELPTVC